jgi:hypothetical protein
MKNVEDLKQMYTSLKSKQNFASAEADFRDALEDHCFHIAGNIGRTLGYTDDELVNYVGSLDIRGIPKENFREYLLENPIELSLLQEVEVPWNTYRHNPDHTRK